MTPTSVPATRDCFLSLDLPVEAEYLFASVGNGLSISSPCSSGIRVVRRLLICTGGEPGVGSWMVTSGRSFCNRVSGVEMMLLSRVCSPDLKLSGR